MKISTSLKQGCLVSLATVCLATASFNVFAGTTNTTLGVVVNDSAITAKIKAQLVADQLTSAQNIKVETNKGEVTLAGMVGSETEASKAVEIAESTDGVKDVNTDNLQVKDSTQPMTDAYITAKIKGKIVKEKLMSSANVPLTGVKVETKNGHVFLSGEVDSKAQEEQLKNLAKSVKGVTEVTADLRLAK